MKSKIKVKEKKKLNKRSKSHIQNKEAMQRGRKRQ